ncbi:MAG: conjugative transfer protein MobI(A/C) [Hydrogenophaga sp.]|nr:conjugative transfer protein MobI(A/C) [Hydrogenophaga sp.]
MNETENELQHYQDAIAGMEACITFLFDQAQAVSNAYLEEVADLDRLNSRAGLRKMGVGIQLSCTRKGNHLDLKWTGVKWYGSKASRTSKWIAITKTKEKQCYTIERLRPYAQEWQIELIRETEEKLTRIRRKATHVVAAITNMRNAIRVFNADEDVKIDAMLYEAERARLEDVGVGRHEI